MSTVFDRESRSTTVLGLHRLAYHSRGLLTLYERPGRAFWGRDDVWRSSSAERDSQSSTRPLYQERENPSFPGPENPSRSLRGVSLRVPTDSRPLTLSPHLPTQASFPEVVPCPFHPWSEPLGVSSLLSDKDCTFLSVSVRTPDTPGVYGRFLLGSLDYSP